MTEHSLFNTYLSEGFKPLRCKGYNPHYNPKKDYKIAKQAIDEGFTKDDFSGLSLEEIEAWEKTGGWIGWVIPKGYIALDVEDKESCIYLESILKDPAKHNTNRGKHYLCKTNGKLSASSEVYTKAGIKVTYRVGGKNYLILAPINNRSWEPWKFLKDLPELPKELFPYNQKDINDVLNVLSWGLGDVYRKGLFHGYDDIDTSFMAFLIDCELTEEQIHRAFRLVFLSAYDERRTQMMYDRAKAKLSSGDAIRGTGTFIQRLKELDMREIQNFAKQIQRATGKNHNSNEFHRSIRVVSISEFLRLELPPRENILKPWLPTQGLAMVYGPRGIGKTHFGMGVAVAVASGGVFLKWESANPFGVLYLDGEMPSVVVQERFSNIIISSEKEPVAALNLVTPDLQEWGMPDLSTYQGQKILEDHLEGISLVIVDNISTLCRAGRENEAESWLPVQEWALRLRSKFISVLFVHHTGKGGLQRGTSRREDVLDTVISLKKPGDYMPDEGARFEIHFDKARNLHGDILKPFEVKLVTMHGIQEWAFKTLEDSLTERVAKLLNEGVPQHEIPELLGVAKGTVSKHKRKSQERGLVC